MNNEPRHQAEYDSRQVQAARRVLVDLGQVLAAFQDCLVVVGGWVPDLLILEAEEPHVGSIDVDVALDAGKLNEGRYAELLKLLFDSRCYRPGAKPFQLLTDVDLGDGGQRILGRWFAGPRQISGHRGLRHRNPQLEQFSVDAGCTPQRVGLAHAPN